MIKTELDSMPAELDEQNRKIMQLEIEETALKKETDHLSQDRLAALQKELAELRDDFNAKRLSGRTRRAQLTRSASFVKRLSPQRMKSRQRSRTMTWKGSRAAVRRASKFAEGAGIRGSTA